MMHDAQPPPSHYESSILTLTPKEITKVKEKAFQYMDLLEGWCSKEKASILIDLVLKTRPDKIVEIGVFGGKSLIPMAYALQVNKKGMIYGIDPWDSDASVEWSLNPINATWWKELNHNAILLGLQHKIELFHLHDQIELIVDTSENASPIPEIDILHVDGNHAEVTSYLDVTKWVPLVKSGGWIIFDDMSWFENNTYTTAKAVDWLNTHCTKLAEFNDIDLWGIWIKP